MSLKIRQWARMLKPAQTRALVRKHLKKIQRRLAKVDDKVLTFEPRPGVDVKGDVLIAYIIDAFLLKDGPEPVDESKVPYGHTHLWESLQIVQTFLDLGYRVDAISWQNTSFTPTKPYRVAMDVRILLEHWEPHLPADCIKILHAETSHWTVHNPAQLQRLEDLSRRRNGRRVAPNKMIQESRSLEVADCVTFVAEKAEFLMDSYRQATDDHKPFFQIPISTPKTYPVLDRDYDRIRRSFVWFGSGGLVHKGLDLVLEAFAGMPDYNLTVCGPIQQERDFEREYWQELYHTPNIRLHGWIDITSQDFVDVMSSHVAVVLASCSEAQNGGVITCMHAGLIPIVSRGTGVPAPPGRGILLPDTEVETIRGAVREVAGWDVETLRATSTAARDHVRERHTRERFAEVYRQRVEEILRHFGAAE